MSEKPTLMDFTAWLAENYCTNGSSARAGVLGDYYFKCDGDTEYVFRWTGSEFEEIGIVPFDSEYAARAAHRELCSASGEGVSWNPTGFIEKYN